MIVTNDLILNAAGIVFEIAGFVILLRAVGRLPPMTGGFDPGTGSENIYGLRNKKLNDVGIIAVIIGLALQLIALFTT